MKNVAAHAADLLRQAGLRRTPVRVGVIEVLSAGAGPMSVPQILGKMKGVDSVTVYRTLNTFARQGLVHRVRGEDRTWLYAVGETGPRQTHRHPHFVCESCGRVECLESAEIPDRFVKSLGVNSGYIVRYSEVLLHGLCPRCNVEE